ncbi:MAG: hydroxyacid dehydrogenase [Rhodospirillales bacterium]|jgi:(S)-sulfolactate dehydrogenase
MADVVIAEFMDEDAVEALRRNYDVLYEPTLVDNPDKLADVLTEARALIVRNRTQVRGAVLDAGKKLEAVGRLGVGLDNIDTLTCEARGIKVLPASGANDLAVKEYVIAGLLMLFRGAYHASDDMATGLWPREKLMKREVSGRSLGLIGFGSIARDVAAAAQLLGMSVSAFDPYVAADDLVWQAMDVANVTFEQVMRESDAVSLHVPLTDGTKNLIDQKALSLMKSDAYLINSARGGVVDEAALAKALKDGTIAGAMLDVFEQEPLPAENVFAGVPNLILTPHIAGVTEDSNVRVSAVTVKNVRDVLEGK